MKYATVEQIQAGFRSLDTEEQAKAEQLLEEAGILIDAAANIAKEEAKMLVSCRMIRRALGDGSAMSGVPMGATQGSLSALGYSQSWTMGSGSTGELYLDKTDRRILGLGNRIACVSPLEQEGFT